MNLFSKASNNESLTEVKNIHKENINNNTMNHILINKNLDYYDDDRKQEIKSNNNFINKSNYLTNNFNDNINSQEDYKNEESKNSFKDNLQNNLPNNTHYYNSYINQLSMSKQNKDVNYNNYYENDNDINKDDYYNKEENTIKNKQNSLQENKAKKIKYLNAHNDQNVLSSLINSGSFSESYKRNKELKHNLNFIYNERRIDNE